MPYLENLLLAQSCQLIIVHVVARGLSGRIGLGLHDDVDVIGLGGRHVAQLMAGGVAAHVCDARRGSWGELPMNKLKGKNIRRSGRGIKNVEKPKKRRTRKSQEERRCNGT